MVHNPFNDSLDWALRGKYARVHTDYGVFEGWVERVHHDRGSVILHDATETSAGEDVGSVFVRTPELVTVLKPKKKIEWRQLDTLARHPEYDFDITPKDEVMRRCYRNQFAGGFPVVTSEGVIINGHKRITAARAAGLTHHPVEVVDVTDEEAEELLQLAHREQFSHGDEGSEDNEDEDTPDFE